MAITREQERKLFYYEMGCTIGAWSMVEYALFVVYANCFPRARWRTLHAAFYSIENFRSKLQVTDRCFKEQFDQSSPLFKRWEELCNKLTSDNRARNQLAHRVRGTYPSQRPGRRIGLVEMVEHYDAMYAPLDTLRSKAGTLFVRDVHEIGMRFRGLSHDLMNLALAMRPSWKGRLSASLSPRGKPPQLQQLISRMRRGLSAQPKPSPP